MRRIGADVSGPAAGAAAARALEDAPNTRSRPSSEAVHRRVVVVMAGASESLDGRSPAGIRAGGRGARGESSGVSDGDQRYFVGIMMVRHMCAEGLASQPSPSFGCRKWRPTTSVNSSSSTLTFGSNA